MTTETRCKICGNPNISTTLSGDNPNTVVCDWACASILNTKLIVISSIVGLMGVLGALLIQLRFFLFLFVPFSLFSLYSLFLIITKKKQKARDRLKFVGEEDEDEINFYTR